MLAENQNVSQRSKTEHNGQSKDLSKDFQDLSKATSTMASDAASLIQKNASHLYEQGVEQAKKIGAKVEDRVQNHPMQSLLIVAGVGLLLGALWNRR